MSSHWLLDTLQPSVPASPRDEGATTRATAAQPTARMEATGAIEEIGIVDSARDLDHRALDDLVSLIDGPVIGVGYEQVRRLIMPPDPSPKDDESLLGIIARAAFRSEVPQMVRVLALAGIETAKPATAPTMYADRAEALAVVLRLPQTEVIQRMYPEVESDGPVRMMDFFGVRIPACYREPRYRRVSPRALTASTHHRAAWELRPLPFDRQTMQVLIDTCEICGEPFGWRRAHKANECERCRADIRVMKAKDVAADDQFPCAMAAGLIDPNPAVRAQARSNIPGSLSAWENGELFDLCVRLARVAEAPSVSHSSSKLAEKFTQTWWSAAKLATGVRVVIGWPDSFYQLCDRLRAEAYQRRGAYGVSKDLGPLYAFVANQSVPKPIRELLGATLDDYYKSLKSIVFRGRDYRSHGEHQGYINMRAAAKLCGTTIKVIRRVLDVPEMQTLRVQNVERSPIFVNQQQILAINEIRKTLLDVRQAQAATGFPEYALLYLAQRNNIRRETGAAAVMAGPRSISSGIWFERATISAFMDRLTGIAKPSCHQKAVSPLSLTLRNSRMIGVWIPVLESIIDGRLEVFWDSGGTSSPIAERLLVAAHEIEPLLATHEFVPLPGRETDSTMSTLAAAEYLNTTEAVIINLLKEKGGIESALWQGRRRPFRSSVEAFARDHMLGGEVCQTLGLSKRRVTSTLARRGVEPAFRIYEDRPIWRRWEIEAFAGISDRVRSRPRDRAGRKEGHNPDLPACDPATEKRTLEMLPASSAV
jgi:hypothetical protein